MQTWAGYQLVTATLVASTLSACSNAPNPPPDASRQGDADHDSATDAPVSDGNAVADARDADRDADGARDTGPPGVCGNGRLERGEECDDNDLTSGDGCSERCRLDELVCAGTRPDFIGDSSTLTFDTRGEGANAAGSCGGGAAPEVVLAIGIFEPSDLWVTTDRTATDFDTAVYLRSACSDRATELGCASEGTLGDTLEVRALSPGTYFLFIDGVGADVGKVDVEVRITPRLADGAACDPMTGPRCLPTSRCATSSAGGARCTSGTAPCDADTFALGFDAPVSGTTRGARDLQSPTCTDDGTSPDATYRVVVTEPGSDLIVTATPADFDLVMSLETSCDDATVELDCSDGRDERSAETLLVEDATPGAYYFTVDGFRGTSGNFTISARQRRIVDLGGTCETGAMATRRCRSGLSCMGGVCVDPAATACSDATTIEVGATRNGMVATGTSSLAPTCARDGRTHEDIHRVTLTSRGYLVVQNDSTGTRGSIYVRGPSLCAFENELSCVATAARARVRTSALNPGDYYIVVDGTGAYSITPRVLAETHAGDACDSGATTRCDRGTACIDGRCAIVDTDIDVTPNARFCDAQGPYTSDALIDGAMEVGGAVTDYDTFALDLATPGPLSIRVSDGYGGCSANLALDLHSQGTSTCEAMDSVPFGEYPTIATAAGTATNCPELLAVERPALQNLAAGRYYVRVRSNGSPGGPYELVIDRH